MGIEQHLVPLAGIGHQPEGAAGTQLQVRHLHLVEHAAHHQPSSLQSNWKASPSCKTQGDKRLGRGLAGLLAPGTDEVGDAAVAAPVALGLDLLKQRLARAPGMLGSVGVGGECRLQGCLEGVSLPSALVSPVLGWATSPGALSHFLTVLRDSPVSFAIALLESLSRSFMRLTLPIISMVITLFALLKNSAGSGTPWSILDRHFSL